MLENEDPRDVALKVCGLAHDVEDARFLLSALGLLDNDILQIPKGPAPGMDVVDIKEVRSIGKTVGFLM